MDIVSKNLLLFGFCLCNQKAIYFLAVLKKKLIITERTMGLVRTGNAFWFHGPFVRYEGEQVGKERPTLRTT